MMADALRKQVIDENRHVLSVYIPNWNILGFVPRIEPFKENPMIVPILVQGFRCEFGSLTSGVTFDGFFERHPAYFGLRRLRWLDSG
ncbi:hypothetical protein CF645_34560 [Burkholderia pseudomallei]|nr:hypothetical protein CF640_32540 [Burkholderia pseudomallei]PNX15644.1 hypothetical protein CF645_34560 [Burkholderia pseudomallei]